MMDANSLTKYRTKLFRVKECWLANRSDHFEKMQYYTCTFIMIIAYAGGILICAIKQE